MAIASTNLLLEDKLINILKENFSESDMKLFELNYKFYTANKDNLDGFIVDFDEAYKWMGFTRKGHAKTLLESKNCKKENNFHINEDYIIKINKTIASVPAEAIKFKDDPNKTRGGQNKENIFLTINCFKKFCLKASTEQADKIYDYYIKIETIIAKYIEDKHKQIIDENNNKEKLLQLKDEEIKNKEIKINDLIKSKELEKQNILLREFGNIGSLVYIMKVKTYTNKTYVIKIGESRLGVSARFNEHKLHYDEILLLDCFLVNQSKDFESFLHNHEKIKNTRINNLINHENEKELFLIGENLSYSLLLKIIKSNIKNFENNNIEKMKLECEKLKLLNDLSHCDKFNYTNEINDNKLILKKSIILKNRIKKYYLN